MLSALGVDNISVEALMFQTGYLTIDSFETIGAEQFITLRYTRNELSVYHPSVATRRKQRRFLAQCGV